MKIVFLSLKSLLDKNSGAALEIKLVLENLAKGGMECSSISLNCYDTGDDYTQDETIDARLSPKNGRGGFFHYDDQGMRHYLYVGRSKDTMKIDQTDLNGFLKNAASFLRDFKPDVVIFFGSNELIPLLELAKKNGAKILFYTGTASYQEERKPLFDISDSLIVPTSFIGSLYKNRFGNNFHVIPTTLPFDIVAPDPEHMDARRILGPLTLINPTPDKGAHFLFHIAKNYRLRHRTFLCVESRGNRSFWRTSGIDISKIENVHWVPWQTEIGHVLGTSAVLLMPSLVAEAAGKVIAEAMALGVPCMGFDIGGIKEQIGQGGITLPFDDRLSAHPDTLQYQAQVPSDSVLPWVNGLDALLSDKAHYAALAGKAVEEATRFLPENTILKWAEEIRNITRKL